MLSCWKAASRAYIVAEAYIVTTATHVDRLVISGQKMQSDHLEIYKNLQESLVMFAAKPAVQGAKT